MKTRLTILDNGGKTCALTEPVFGRQPLFTPLATNIPGQPGTTSYTDTNAPGASLLFYRVGVGN